MMIAAIGKSGSIGTQSGGKRRTVEPATAAENRAGRDSDRDGGHESPSTALVPLDRSKSRQRTARSVWFNRPSAPFLAQMIATRADMPQTRARRRAEPAEAIAVYDGTATRAGNRQPGRRLRISL